MDRKMYHVALDGVTRYALSEAVKAVHRNALGHPFFPQPSELRKLCDDAQRPIDNQRRRERTIREMQDDRASFLAAKAAQTPEARARVAAIYQNYCDSLRKDKEEPFVSKLDPELLAQVPDAPKRAPEGFKQARVA